MNQQQQVVKEKKRVGRPKLNDYWSLNDSARTLIDQLVMDGLGYKGIIFQLAFKNIPISEAELRKNVKTLNEPWTKREHNKAVRVAYDVVDGWMDASQIDENDHFTNEKTARILWFNGWKNHIKLIGFTDKAKNRHIIPIVVESTGEKKEYFTKLLGEVGLKGWLNKGNGESFKISIDSSMKLNKDEQKQIEDMGFNVELVRQEKNVRYPYQSEVEGIFGLVKTRFISWLKGNKIAFKRHPDKKDWKNYYLTEKQILNQFYKIRTHHIEKGELYKDVDLS